MSIHVVRSNPGSAVAVEPSKQGSQAPGKSALQSLSLPDASRPETDRFNETRERGERIARREESFASMQNQIRDSSGLFGKFHRTLTLSDPYQIEIDRSRRTASVARNGIELLRAAEKESDPARKIDQLNQARRLFGMREVDSTWTESGDKPQSVGLNTVSTDQSHHELEQKAISVSRDVAVYTTVSLGSIFAGIYAAATARAAQTTGAVVHTTLTQAIAQGAKYGGTGALLESGAISVDNVQSGQRTVRQATGDVAKATATGIVAGGLFGAVANRIGSLFRLLRPGSGGVAGTSSSASPKPVPEGALRVDGDELDIILNSPSIEHERNAMLRTPTLGDEALVGAGVSNPRPPSLTAKIPPRSPGVPDPQAARSPGKGSGGGRTPKDNPPAGSGGGGTPDSTAGSGQPVVEPKGASAGSTTSTAPVHAEPPQAPIPKALSDEMDLVIRTEYAAQRSRRDAHSALKVAESLAPQKKSARRGTFSSEPLLEQRDKNLSRALEMSQAAADERIKFLQDHPELKEEFRERARAFGKRLRAPQPGMLDTGAVKKRIAEFTTALDQEIDDLLAKKQSTGLTVAESDRVNACYDLKTDARKHLEKLAKFRDNDADKKALELIEKQYPPKP